ncbi:MAG TPA: hypothetical protein VLA04_01455 [Verrucomicrobiae bacterium]|nr:hypothetical protein [Verrucomicrobiae bacterium]
MTKPYIGITDFTDFDQVQAMQRIVPPDSDYLLHVGVMMSHRTLHGLPTEWAKAFPAKETIASIFASPDTYNCLHYADYKSRPGLADSLATALSYVGKNITGLQLDMTWPDPGELLLVQEQFPEMEIILQVGKQALLDAESSPAGMAARIKEYEGIISRVLLDQSVGKGVPMDAQLLIALAKTVQDSFPDMGIVFAGGLGPASIHLLEPIRQAFPDLRFSIDAQGRLRASGSALDPIDWELARLYLQRALAFLA